MTEIINKVYDPELFRKAGHNLVDLCADYLKKCVSGEKMKVFQFRQPEEWVDDYDKLLNTDTSDSIDNFYKKVIEDSIHIHHPNYAGHMVSPVIPLSALSDFLGSFLDNGVGVYEMGSPTVAMERIIVKKMSGIIGMPENAGGIITSGGTLANLTCLLTARQSKTDYNIWEEDSRKQLAFLVSTAAHFSIERAVKIMGFGTKGLIKVPVNEKYQMRPECLENIFNEAKSKGIKVIGVIANAGSTATGSYDPLDKISDFCKKYNLWFHIDGAHGGPAVFSKKYKHLVKGIEQADSVILDFHKMMMMPALSTLVLFKDENTSYETFAQKADYLWDKPQDKEWFNLAKRTFECTKRMLALTVFSVFRTYGFEFFSENITSLFDLAAQFAGIIEETEDFELALKPQANIVCFRYKPSHYSENELNELNSSIREYIIEKGDFYIVKVQLDNNTYFRTSIMNPFTDINILKKLLLEIRTPRGRFAHYSHFSSD